MASVFCSAQHKNATLKVLRIRFVITHCTSEVSGVGLESLQAIRSQVTLVMFHSCQL